MSKTSFALKLDDDFQKELKDFCEKRGLKQGPFVEKAVKEQMEREEMAEDLLDLYTLRPTEHIAISLDEYLRKRK